MEILVDILCRQHRAIERLLALADRPYVDLRQARSIAFQLRSAFVMNARSEEQIVYPQLAASRGVASTIEVARGEHEAIARELAALCDPMDVEMWRVGMWAVRWAVERHFEDEEQVLLPHLLTARAATWRTTS